MDQHIILLLHNSKNNEFSSVLLFSTEDSWHFPGQFISRRKKKENLKDFFFKWTLNYVILKHTFASAPREKAEHGLMKLLTAVVFTCHLLQSSPASQWCHSSTTSSDSPSPLITTYTLKPCRLTCTKGVWKTTLKSWLFWKVTFNVENLNMSPS